jgi:hypothetical protein
MVVKNNKLQIESEIEIVRVASKEQDTYENYALAELTAYSLFWLSKWEFRCSIEAISILNWRLFPTKFGMVGFPQFPDALRTNRSLLQGQPKYRNILSGSAKKGYTLNGRGIQIAQHLTKKFGPPTTSDGSELGELHFEERAKAPEKQERTIDPSKEIGRIQGSILFEKWKSNLLSERDAIHVYSLLGIFSHTPLQVRRRRMKELKRSAKEVGNKEIVKFLEDITQTFTAILSSP